jgi:hypothetical protein
MARPARGADGPPDPPLVLNRVPGASLRKGEIAAAGLVAVAVALAMHWPLPLHLDSSFAKDLGDPSFQAWQVAWGGHALLHQPLDFFQSNAYWPLRNTFAFSDALIGYAPAGLIGNGPEAAVVRYNLLFLFAYALAFLGAYLLARELGARPLGAAVAGAAFAYAPWRLDHDNHLNLLSSGGIPLSLFLLLRGYRGQLPWLVVSGWLVAAWQLSLGFNLGLQIAYLLAVLFVVAAAPWLGRRRRLNHALLGATVAGAATFALVTVVLARPYADVADRYPEARRPALLVAAFSPPLRSYLAAPEDNLLWGGATAGVRDRLAFPDEQSLFPGLLTVGLAGLGLFSAGYPRRLRVGLALAAGASGLLAIGFSASGPRQFAPYRLLYHALPGWDAIRVPARINTLTSLALALLAALGATALINRLRGPAQGESRVRQRLVMRTLVGILLVTGILVEGSGFRIGEPGKGLIASPPSASVPRAPPRQFRGGPQAQLPLGRFDTTYMLWSTDGFPKIVNGAGSFNPHLYVRLLDRLENFPDRQTVVLLRRLGVRTAILHPRLAFGTPWASAASKSIQGLHLTRTRRVADGVVIFRLDRG